MSCLWLKCRQLNHSSVSDHFPHPHTILSTKTYHCDVSVMDQLILLELIINFYVLSTVNCLHIKTLEIVTKSFDTLVFHCDYKVEEDKIPELDIKWYYNDSPSPFMVFLPQHWNQPQILEDNLRDIIEMDVETGGRVWSMKNVTSEHSGLYTCKVSTNSDEVLYRKRVTIQSKILINFHIHLQRSFCL